MSLETFHAHLNHVTWQKLVTVYTYLQISFPKQLLLYLSDTTRHNSAKRIHVIIQEQSFSICVISCKNQQSELSHLAVNALPFISSA